MPKVTFVKSARKANPVAKKGESYYWWAFMQGGRGGPKRYSKTPPKPSQLTQSDFWGAVYSAQETYPAAPEFDGLEAALDDIKSQYETIRDDTQGKYDNLPDGLQQGQSGDLLQERVDAMQSAIDELDGVDLSFDEHDKEDDEEESEYEERVNQAREERAQEIWDEITAAWEVNA